MKKLIVLAVALTLLISGCGSKKNEVASVPVMDIVTAIQEKTVMNGPTDTVNLKENSDVAKMLSISSEDIAEGVYVKAMINIRADELIVLKAADESSVARLKKALEDEGTAQENNWSTYLPDQYEIVKNRIIKQEGPYLMLFIGAKPDVAEQTFTSMLKGE